jgi:hypothetical protein
MNMPRNRSALLVLFVSLVACTSESESESESASDPSAHPKVKDVLQQYAPAVCAKVRECFRPSYDLTYPGGDDECVSKTVAAAEKRYADKLEGRSVCANDVVEQCFEDFAASACPSEPKDLSLPCNC